MTKLKFVVILLCYNNNQILNLNIKMVDKLKHELRIPVWAVSVIIGIIFSLGTYTTIISKSLNQIENNTNNINVLNIKVDNKVDKVDYKDDINKLFIQLNRMEDRLNQKS